MGKAGDFSSTRSPVPDSIVPDAKFTGNWTGGPHSQQNLAHNIQLIGRILCKDCGGFDSRIPRLPSW